MKRTLLLLAMVVACQAAPAVTAAPSPAAAARGGSLVLADWEFPDSLDPIHATTASDLRAATLLFDPLWTLGPNLQPVPRLLREVPTLANHQVKVAAGGMTVDLRLRAGILWSDGSPVSADDIIFTVEAIRSAALPGRDKAAFERIASQQRVSDSEVVWRFDAIDAGYLLLGPQASLLPAHRLASLAAAQWAGDPFFQGPDVVSGPFLFKDAIPGSLIDLAANPDYAAGRARGSLLDALTLRYYNGKAAMIAGLQAGDADLGFHLLPSDRGQLAGLRGRQPLVAPTLREEMLVPNHGPNSGTERAPPWVSDQPLLAALTAAIDRRALNSVAFDGEATATTGLFPPVLGDLDPSAPPAATAPQVKAGLDADGWKAGGDGVRVKGGERLAFTVLAPCDSEPRQAEQAELVRQWALVGAAATAACAPSAAFFSAGGVIASGAFDIALYSNDWEPDPGAWAAGLAWGRCADSRLAQDFTAGAATLDPGARRAAYRDAASRWVQEQCTIPLYRWPAVVERSAAVHGFEPNPIAGLETWNAADWS